MTSPRISVITPSLNYGRFIEDAILSVAGQNYPSFEHIVVDGGSTDETLATLRRYPHLRWISEPDKGQSDALNKGFRMSTGDLVGWLNADEYYLPGALHAVAEFAAAHPGADVIYGDSIDVDEEGRVRRCTTAHSFVYPLLLYYGCFIQTDATFFRRTLFEQRLLLDIDYRIVMDYEYFVRLARSNKRFHYIKRFLGAFRWHGSNMAFTHPERKRKERLLVQHTWSAMKMPDHGYDTLAQLARLYHVALKVLNGNYRSQLKALRSRGSETRWFQNDEGRKTCATLLA